MDISTGELIIPEKLKNSDIYVILFRNMGWDVSVDKFGNLRFTVDKNKNLKDPPSTYHTGCYKYRIFVDGISYEEDSIGYLGKGTLREYSYKIEGNITLIMQNMIHKYIYDMIRNKSEFIIFPDNTSEDKMINAIVDMFPNKYTREMLESKKFII